MRSIEQLVADLEARIEKDGKEFCESLFHHATVRLLAAKYAYYELNRPFISDYTYDIEEKHWYVMGRALGLLKEDETSPCVDWDHTHPAAAEAKKLAERLIRK